jgi:hypothetical protein
VSGAGEEPAGATVGDVGAEGDGRPEVELLDVTPAAGEQQVVSTGGGGPILLAGAVLLGVVGFALWSFSGVAPESPADPTTGDPDDGPATTVPVVTSAPPPTTVVEVAVGGSDPLLDTTTGLSILMGGAALRRLDLDTGELTTYDVRGVPLYASASRLVMISPGGSVLRSVPLDDPGAEGVVLSDRVTPRWPPYQFVAGPRADEVWMLAGDEQVWELVNLVDGTRLEQLPGPTTVSGLSFDPMVATSPAAGIFVRRDQRYEEVFPGSLIGVSDTHVLAQTCDQPTVCELHWLSRPTWEEVDRPVPDLAPTWAGWVSPGGLMLGVYILDTATGSVDHVVFDVERDRIVELPGPPSEIFSEQPAFSRDGRLIAMPLGDGVVVYDTGDGGVYQLDWLGNGDWPLVFVENR